MSQFQNNGNDAQAIIDLARRILQAPEIYQLCNNALQTDDDEVDIAVMTKPHVSQSSGILVGVKYNEHDPTKEYAIYLIGHEDDTACAVCR